MEHTPTPWYVASTGNHQGLVVAENTGENVAVTYDKADAPFIAKAANAHDALLASCQDLMSWIVELFPNPEDQPTATIKEAKAAIAKAMA